MYEAFYSYSAKPFQLSPDPRFFFNSRVHKRALAYLRYGIKQGEGFIIITGDVGTGKTTLVSTLFPSLERENIVAAQVVTTQMQADDLLRMVAAGFGLQYQRVGKAALLKSLEDFFRACVKEGKRVLLIVDEAQGLPKKAIEELRMLSNFQMSGRSLLQSFLLGQREFRQTMRSPGFEQLRQRVIAAYHLKPLDRGEARAYVQHRLRLVGWKGDNPALAEEVFDKIFDFTGGVPRRMNTLCDRLLLFGFLEELHAIGGAEFDAVARDLIEEQGGVDEGLDEAPPLAEPAPVPPVAESLPVQRPEGQRTEDQRPEDQRPGDQRPEDQRLAAVENSVATLADAIREELSSLRKVLLEERRRSDEHEER